MNKTVMITGASRGIGAATALLFAENGYNVALAYKSQKESAQRIANKIKELGANAQAFCCDVSCADSVEQTVQAILKAFGKIDVLVNNAGIAQQRLFTDISTYEWHTMINTNLSSVFYCSKAVLPHMLSRHSGRIINLASMWGETGGSCEVHYSAAKAGVIGLTKALAKEVAPSGITVNCVSPGVILTDMMQNFDEQTLQELKDETPARRLGTPKDIAGAIYFLAGEEASFITGQVLGVNGGIVC